MLRKVGPAHVTAVSPRAEEALGADRLVFPGQASAPGVVSVVCQCYQVSERGVTVP